MSNKISSFNNHNIRDMRFRFANAVKDLEKDMGISFQLGRITFNSGEFRGKLTCTVSKHDASGATIDPDLARFHYNAHRYGLTAEDLKRTITFVGRTLRIAGMRAGKTKYPFLVSGINGGRYKMSAYQLLTALGKPEAINFKPAPRYRRLNPRVSVLI